MTEIFLYGTSTVPVRHQYGTSTVPLMFILLEFHKYLCEVLCVGSHASGISVQSRQDPRYLYSMVTQFSSGHDAHA